MPAHLPLPRRELAQRLSRPLTADREPALTVVDVSLPTAPRPQELILLVDVARSGSTEHWRLALPVSAEDLDGSMSVDAFVTTIRANVEEWWDTRAFDAETRSWGERR